MVILNSLPYVLHQSQYTLKTKSKAITSRHPHCSQFPLIHHHLFLELHPQSLLVASIIAPCNSVTLQLSWSVFINMYQIIFLAQKFPCCHHSFGKILIVYKTLAYLPGFLFPLSPPCSLQGGFLAVPQTYQVHTFLTVFEPAVLSTWSVPSINLCMVPSSLWLKSLLKCKLLRETLPTEGSHVTSNTLL